MQRLKIALFKIKCNANPKPGIGQFWIHLHRFFIKSACVVHLFQLFVAFPNGAIGIGIRLFVLKCLAINFYCLSIFLQVYQCISLIEISRGKIILY
ncbi:hypothetical protein GALL_467560 [mine drainage metagenome]|uniref:Uncharacterized protein n=1 Tax=mine drainage metagenome TaxID=410659 RepID=A0A1J5PJ61_9ZZZZ